MHTLGSPIECKHLVVLNLIVLRKKNYSICILSINATKYLNLLSYVEPSFVFGSVCDPTRLESVLVSNRIFCET